MTFFSRSLSLASFFLMVCIRDGKSANSLVCLQNQRNSIVVVVNVVVVVVATAS